MNETGVFQSYMIVAVWVKHWRCNLKLLNWCHTCQRRHLYNRCEWCGNIQYLSSTAKGKWNLNGVILVLSCPHQLSAEFIALCCEVCPKHV